jgi:hypothetical protein
MTRGRFAGFIGVEAWSILPATASTMSDELYWLLRCLREGSAIDRLKYAEVVEAAKVADLVRGAGLAITDLGRDRLAEDERRRGLLGRMPEGDPMAPVREVRL